MIHSVFFIPLCVFEFLYSYEDTEMKSWDFIVVPFPAQPRGSFVGGMVLGLVGHKRLCCPGLENSDVSFWGVS